MHILALQYDILWENRQGNFEKVTQLLDQVRVPEGSLIVLPEMFASGFSMNVDRIFEAQPSDTEGFLAGLALEYKSWVLGGLVDRSSNGMGINKLVVMNPDGNKLGEYQKNHCFSFTGESEHYQPGSDLFLFDWQDFRVCPTICYDLRFPELYRRGVRAGANLFPVIASWPVDRIDHWDTLLRARAIENQAIVVGVNRTGADPKWQYAGHSCIIDHQGVILNENEGDETVVSANVSLEALLDWRKRFKALQDMKS